MMVNLEALNKYSGKASWAVWNEADLPAKEVAKSHLTANCTWSMGKAGLIIQKYQKSLRTDVVILGINASNQCSNWSNYHFGGKSADKNLMFAFDKSPYRGCYMTDISHVIQKKAADVYRELLADKAKLELTILSFIKELDEVGAPKNALFLILGTHTAKLFRLTLQDKYHNFIELKHCSAHGISAHDWVECTWCKINNYTAKNKNVLPFEVGSEMNEILSNL
jgi:hypothetical protein